MKRIAIVGVGNCACALVQAISAIRRGEFIHHELIAGLEDISPASFEVAAAFDVDVSKVGRPLAEAIFAAPNCTTKYYEPEQSGVVVQPGIVGDSLNGPLSEVVVLDPRCNSVNVSKIAEHLRKQRVDILLIYLPVGSQIAAEAYTAAALEATVSVINNTPAVLAGSELIQRRFLDAGLVIMGDDMKSHIGSTTLHQALLAVLSQRRVAVTRSYQLNIGGNSDFLNMRDSLRSAPKRATKARALARFPGANAGSGIGPSDYVPYLKDHKVGYIRLEGVGYLGMPFSMELRLDVEDSPNAAAVAIEAMRTASKLLDGGHLDVEAVGYELFKAPSLRHGPSVLARQESPIRSAV